MQEEKPHWLKREGAKSMRPRQNKIIAPIVQQTTMEYSPKPLLEPSPKRVNEASQERSLPRSETRQYLQNMLINKMKDKYAADSDEAKRLVEGEVFYFVNSSSVTKNSIRAFEAKLSRKLSPELRMSLDFVSKPPPVAASRSKRVAQSISVTPYDKLLPKYAREKASPNQSISPERLDLPYGLNTNKEQTKKPNLNRLSQRH